MDVVAKEVPWARIEINTRQAKVRVVQRWAYTWVTAMGAGAWTDAEKKTFHDEVVRLITSRIKKDKVKVAAKDRCLVHDQLDLEFDIGWSLEKWKHWTVYARKLPAGSTPTTLISEVRAADRIIYLDSADTADYNVCNAAAACRTFNAVPHEFIHTFTGPDEYNGGSFLPDTDSVLNIGDELRERHIRLLLKELNTMITGWTFSY